MRLLSLDMVVCLNISAQSKLSTTLSGDKLKAADTDHDGEVKITDLATLLQYVSHVIESLE